jgi:hypothetical protein
MIVAKFATVREMEPTKEPVGLNSMSELFQKAKCRPTKREKELIQILMYYLTRNSTEAMQIFSWIS